MNTLSRIIRPKFFNSIILILLGVVVAQAKSIRTQTISFHKGWNTVYLQVDPTNSKPAECFSGTPISIAAAYVGDGSAVQYVQNPSTNSVNKDNGWSVWYAPDRPDAFLTQLFNLSANNAYLIYSQSEYVWSVTGTVVLGAVKWKPNSFNLAGFCLDDLSPPTFDQFFAASAAHNSSRIYRLVNGQWVLVDHAQTTQMRSGEAYWIYCAGGSDYQGPLDVRIQNGQQVLVSGVNQTGILLANKTGNPLSVRVENSTSSRVLPLAYVLRVVTGSNVVSATFDLPATYNMPVFDANESRGFWLTLRPEKMTASSETTLLKITTDIGTQCWLALTGNRSELNQAN
jgi:hypothetical protein